MKKFIAKAGTPNIKINREVLEERAVKIGITDNQLEILSDSELNHLVILKELQNK